MVPINMQPKIFIGGVGGSGTRVLCAIAQRLGIHMGSDFNKAQDALWFSLLYMHPGMMTCSERRFQNLSNLYAKAFRGGGLTYEEVKVIEGLADLTHTRWSSEWVRARADSFITSANSSAYNGVWGWKEPNSHIFAERFLKIWPNVKYLHMWRDGLDMSVSKNQNQIKFWGKEYPGGIYDMSKKSSLSYWVNVHKNIVDIALRFPGRVKFLNFEDLCNNPRERIKNFMSLCDFKVSESKLAELCEIVSPPETIGRGNNNEITDYDIDDYIYATNFKQHLMQLNYRVIL